jgi:ubiquitin-conjugating enzyme E2 Q
MDCDDQGGDVGSEGEEDMGLYGDDMETENEEAAMDSDDEDEDMYYDDDDLDPDDDLSSMELEVEGGATAPAAQNQPAPQTVASTTNYVPGTLDYTALPMLPAPREGGGAAALRLMKELREIDKTIKRSDATALGWHVDVESVTNVFQWMVELHSFPAEAALTADMRGAGITSVVLELRFLPSYPMSPPFVRVVRPRLLAFAQGGGGHVTAGGALCMKTLTADGWRAILDLDNVFQQIRFALVEEPRPARLERPVVKNAAYSWAEAVDGYLRACRTHGWRVPDGFVEAHRA